MAAFTALAIGLGVGALAGSIAARRRKSAEANKLPEPVAAPTPTGSLAAPAPPDAGQAASLAAGAAQQAAIRQRRKGMSFRENTGITGKGSSIATPVAQLRPRSLSGY